LTPPPRPRPVVCADARKRSETCARERPEAKGTKTSGSADEGAAASGATAKCASAGRSSDACARPQKTTWRAWRSIRRLIRLPSCYVAGHANEVAVARAKARMAEGREQILARHRAGAGGQ